MPTYPHDDKTIEKLDQILEILFEKREYRLTVDEVIRFDNQKNVLDKKFGEEGSKQKIDHNSLIRYCCGILVNKGLIEPSGLKTNGTLWLIPPGIKFMDAGGFKADKERFEVEQKVLEEKEKKREEYFDMQFNELKERLKKAEDTIRLREAFWEAAPKSLKIQKRYYSLMLLMTAIAIAVSLLNVYLYFYYNQN